MKSGLLFGLSWRRRYLIRQKSFPVQILALTGFLAGTPSLVAQGTVNFANGAAGVNAPIYDVDGTTKLSGSGYWALLFAGSSAESLTPVVQCPVTFPTGPGAGYFSCGPVALPGVPTGGLAYCQVWVQDFEPYITIPENPPWPPGAKIGYSGVILVATGGGVMPPLNLAGLESFRLVAMPVPEPGIAMLCVLGLALLTAGRGRRHSTSRRAEDCAP